MNRIWLAYLSYLKTAAIAMCAAAVVFFVYGGIRTTGPVASLTWYAVAVAIPVVMFTVQRWILRYEVARHASLLLGGAIQKRKDDPRSVSFVAVCFNEASVARAWALELSTLVREFEDLEAEILLIDDASSDDSGAVLKRELVRINSPRVAIGLFHNEKHLGFEKSQGIGLSRAKGDLVIAFTFTTRPEQESFVSVLFWRMRLMIAFWAPWVLQWSRGVRVAVSRMGAR